MGGINNLSGLISFSMVIYNLTSLRGAQEPKMGLLQNHAIKKSCRGLAKELLNHVANYISRLPENKKTCNREELIIAGLENFVDDFHAFPDVDLNLKSIKYSNYLDLYISILIKSVHADLSYDPSIGTDKHNKLIVTIGCQVLASGWDWSLYKKGIKGWY